MAQVSRGKRGKGRDTIMEKLDRGLATQGWFQQFPYSLVKTIVAAVSDHMPLLFNISDQKQSVAHKTRKFKFENMWLEDEECYRVVKQSWSSSYIHNMLDFTYVVEKCGRTLMQWNMEVYGNLQVRIKNKQLEIE